MDAEFTQKLREYADLTVKVGLGLQPGQRLIICDAPIECAPLVRFIAERAYQAEARLVDVFWQDDALTLARFNQAPRDSLAEFPVWQTEALLKAAQQEQAFLYSYGIDPDLLKGQEPARVALVQQTRDHHRLPHLNEIIRRESNWSVIGMPVRGWAAKIFPQAPPETQLQKLWEVIFTVCRLDQADPPAAWRRHAAQLAARRDYLNEKQYTALKYTAPGVNLTVGLPSNHCWIAGQKQTRWGSPYIPNLPTEEVYTMPHKNRVDGVVTGAKPLPYGGVLIENFVLTFAQGRVVKATAETGQSILEEIVAADENAARLGEVALVPHSSPVSQTGLIFYNILFDENAASHLALGRAYRDCITGGSAMSDEEFAAAGGNDSPLHIDFMIGSEKMNVDGLTGAGDLEPVMRAGEWAF